MSEFVRAGQPGSWRTRISDMQCPRVDACGYRCEAGVGGHDGPHLFEEHAHHPAIPEGAVLVTEAGLAAALRELWHDEGDNDDADNAAAAILAKLRETT